MLDYIVPALQVSSRAVSSSAAERTATSFEAVFGRTGRTNECVIEEGVTRYAKYRLRAVCSRTTKYLFVPIFVFERKQTMSEFAFFIFLEI